MIKIERIKTDGWQVAIRGMRNPMNSWNKSDSKFLVHIGDEGDDVEYEDITCDIYSIADWEWNDLLEKYGYGDNMIIGPNDLELMKKLAKSGTEHAKYRRMIVVWMDITAPLYWWKEFDTYKVGTVANSCSTMHKIHAKEFTMDDFSCEHLINIVDIIHDPLYQTNELDFPDFIDNRFDDIPIVRMMADKSCIIHSPTGMLERTIDMLNKCRDLYLKTKDKKYWWQMIQLLPSSYNQKRTVQLNYEVLAGMYRQRKDHKLDEWRTFCEFLKTLPCSELIIGQEE